MSPTSPSPTAHTPLRLLTLFAPLLLVSLPGDAEVKQSSADASLVAHVFEVRAAPPAVYTALGQIGRWWSGAHSWSKSSANLTLELQAGGCFCERWAEGSAEHARVVFARRDQALHLRGAIGPLQAMALDGVLAFALEPRETGTLLTVTYRVTGDSLHALEALAPAVDGVIGEQVARLKAFVETGTPEPTPPSGARDQGRSE